MFVISFLCLLKQWMDGKKFYGDWNWNCQKTAKYRRRQTKKTSNNEDVK